MIRMVPSCDVCKTDKKEVNHWFILYTGAPDNRTLVDGTEYFVSICKWDDTEASRPGRIHICGHACLMKKISLLAGVPQADDVEEQRRNYASMH